MMCYIKECQSLAVVDPMQMIGACTMSPSSASTSLTSVPLASPPMLGLQLISPMLACGRGVTSKVLAPRLAAAAAASHPVKAQTCWFLEGWT